MGNYLFAMAVAAAKITGGVLLKEQPEAKKIQQTSKDFLIKEDINSTNRMLRLLDGPGEQIPVYSEEGEHPDISKGRFWVIDPLDGSLNFYHQDRFWGVSIALVENNQTNIGVVFLPGLNKFAIAERDSIITGLGNTKKLTISPTDLLSEAQVWTDWGDDKDVVVSIFSKLGRATLYPQLRLCCSASLLAVAEGQIDAYIHPPSPGPEDIAAGCLIVEMAGGKVTDFKGNPWTPLSKSIVASNGLIHEGLLKTIA